MMVVMTTSNVISEMAEKWWPMCPERWFTMQRADDMWFGDELPPTYQALMRSPAIVQAKFMLRQAICKALAEGEQRREVLAQRAARNIAVARVGKGRKRRH
jgi:hypothetical protein